MAVVEHAGEPRPAALGRGVAPAGRVGSGHHQEGRIALGPGNEITDPQLIKVLQAQPILNHDQLLTLAKFYQAYPTNAPTGQHLALVELVMQNGNLGVSQAAFASYALSEEDFEKWLDGGAHKDAGNEDGEWLQFSIRQLPIKGSVSGLPINGISFLVETFASINDDKKEFEKHFIIGVSPF